MKRIPGYILLAILLLALPLLAGCGGDDKATHQVDLGGVGHQDGMADPLRNCVHCHGAELNGDSGPSCYSCHTSADHTIVQNGVAPHLPGPDSSCVACHGPDNGGGLGPACSNCHPGRQ